jgi:hypothetical protein
MHHRLGLTVLLAALAATIPSSASAATNLGAFWHLDESSGTTAVDTSGNANNGAINGASRISGRFGRSLRFDGINDSVSIASSPTLQPTTVTVEGWVRGTNPGNFKHIISKGAALCEVASYGLYTGAGGGAAFYVSDGTDDVNHLAVSPAAPATIWNGAWHHVAGTYDGATVRLFVDGAEVGNGTAVPVPLAIGYATPPISNPAGQLGAFGGGCLLNWAGDLDEPRIWGRALSAQELAASAAMGAPTATTLDEKIDASQAITYTSSFSSGKDVKISIESSTGTERISSVKLQGVLPGLLSLASCRNDLLGLLSSKCDIALSNDGRTATLTVRKLNLFTSGATLRVTVSSGRTFDVNVST